MTLAYPNIVPENNLRLPDALTIAHGPARLLARFILAGDRAAREMGLSLRLRTDGGWRGRDDCAAGALGVAEPPEFADATEENAFAVVAENSRGEIVAIWAARICDWVGTTLAEQIGAAGGGDAAGRLCIAAAAVARRIGGVVCCAGPAWLRPDVCAPRLADLMQRIGEAYACSRWPIDWAVGFAGEAGGRETLGYTVIRGEASCADMVLTYAGVGELYQELADYLAADQAAGRAAPPPSLQSPAMAREAAKLFAGAPFGDDGRRPL